MPSSPGPSGSAAEILQAWDDRGPWEKSFGDLNTTEVLRGDPETGLKVVLATSPRSPLKGDLHAAVAAVNSTFVGPKGCQTRMERSAMSFFKEDGDLALRPHVLFNWLRFHIMTGGFVDLFFSAFPLIDPAVKVLN